MATKKSTKATSDYHAFVFVPAPFADVKPDEVLDRKSAFAAAVLITEAGQVVETWPFKHLKDATAAAAKFNR